MFPSEPGGFTSKTLEETFFKTTGLPAKKTETNGVRSKMFYTHVSNYTLD